jgi:hypothetical protein
VSVGRAAARNAAALTLAVALSVASGACSPGVNLATGLQVDSSATGWQCPLGADDVEEWGTGFLTAAGSDGLAPDATTETLVLKGEYG